MDDSESSVITLKWTHKLANVLSNFLGVREVQLSEHSVPISIEIN